MLTKLVSTYSPAACNRFSRFEFSMMLAMFFISTMSSMSTMLVILAMLLILTKLAACNSLWRFDYHNVVDVDDDNVDNFVDVHVDNFVGVVLGYDFTPSACNMF